MSEDASEVKKGFPDADAFVRLANGRVALIIVGS